MLRDCDSISYTDLHLLITVFFILPSWLLLVSLAFMHVALSCLLSVHNWLSLRPLDILLLDRELSYVYMASCL